MICWGIAVISDKEANHLAKEYVLEYKFSGSSQTERQVPLMYRIGIDLGGTNTKIGIVDRDNRIIDQCSTPTRTDYKADLVAESMIGQALRLMDKNGIGQSQVEGIGVGSPGAIDVVNGIVLYSNNFSWVNVPLLRLLQERTVLPIRIANDAQCALLGETTAGAGRGCRNVVLVTLGTGVGGGVLVDGKLLGREKGGGIIGHMVIRRGGKQCTCGRIGCLEAYASASALIRETKNVVRDNPDSSLARYCEDMGGVDGRTAFDAAQKGDALAQAIIKEYIECLGEGIANLVDLFRPEKILVGGGVCNQGDNLLRPLEKYVRANCFAGDFLEIPLIERAVLGSSAGIIGAAALLTESFGDGD